MPIWNHQVKQKKRLKTGKKGQFWPKMPLLGAWRSSEDHGGLHLVQTATDWYDIAWCAGELPRSASVILRFVFKLKQTNLPSSIFSLLFLSDLYVQELSKIVG